MIEIDTKHKNDTIFDLKAIKWHEKRTFIYKRTSKKKRKML